jgi:hypothetical protein
MVEGGRTGRVFVGAHPVMVGYGTVHPVDDGLFLGRQESLSDRSLPPLDADLGDIDGFRHGRPLPYGVPR